MEKSILGKKIEFKNGSLYTQDGEPVTLFISGVAERIAELWNAAAERPGYTPSVNASSLHDAIVLAVMAHAGRMDKAGKPQIFHVLRVMLAVAAISGVSRAEIIAAVLHDITEDSKVPLESLSGFGSVVVGLVDALTRRDAEAYATYIERVKSNPVATRIKLCDLRDNLGRIDKLTAQTPEVGMFLRGRYEKAIAELSLGRICGACECVIDRDGCGCNPDGA